MIGRIRIVFLKMHGTDQAFFCMITNMRFMCTRITLFSTLRFIIMMMKCAKRRERNGKYQQQ